MASNILLKSSAHTPMEDRTTDAGNSKQYFRRYDLSKVKIIQDKGFGSVWNGCNGQYFSPKKVPKCVHKLLIELSEEKSVPGTIFC
jgi:hypothetical protein